jgi:chorismate synthase
MSDNSYGKLFRVTTWGESHGPSIGCVVDGVPPRIPLCEADLQTYLDQRKPGQNRFTTQRQEPDEVKIMSGVFEGVTTGTPISLIIENKDQRSKDYGDIKDKYRPGHADFTYMEKYGIRDYRGGGRSSARETAMRVAAGGVARKVIGDSIKITGALVQIGNLKINRDNWEDAQISQNPFWCPDTDMVPQWEAYLDKIRKAGSSIGAVIEIRASCVPAGLGAPIYGKLDGDLAAAMMSINAVKGVEIGAGFESATLTGEENADQIRIKDGKPDFQSNHAKRDTIGRHGNETEIMTKGRHDPCVGIRAVPIGEAMMACVLADHIMRHKAQCG